MIDILGNFCWRTKEFSKNFSPKKATMEIFTGGALLAKG